MRNWLTYLLEANLYFAAAYGAYWLLLRKQTFYSANRAYLLLSIVVSFAMPLVQLELPASSTELSSIAAHPSYQIAAYANSGTTTPNTELTLTPNKALEAIFMAGVTVLLVLLFLKLYSLLKLVFANEQRKRLGYTLVLIPDLPSPFSFLGYLFAADEHDLTPAILRHELVHITKKHSWDILFLELVKTISWFNPVIYLAQNSLKTLHEFEADYASANDDSNPDEYVQVLIAKAYQVNGLPFANHFSNKQLLKSRIMKLYQKRSGKLARLTYLITLPLCAGMLCASTMAFSKNYGLLKLKLGRQSNLKNTSASLADDMQPEKKQRLKITSGSMTSITDKLEIRNNGKPLIFTAANLTAENKKMLANWGMTVETTNAPATTYTLVLPPPPPPVPGMPANKSKQKRPHPILPPPPPPPSAQRGRSAKTNAIETTVKNQSDTVAKSHFTDMFKRIARTTRYPTISREKGASGMVVATFRVTQDKKVSDVKIKKGISPELDAEALRSITAYDESVNAAPGTYSLGIDYVVDYGDGSTSYRPVAESEKPTAGIITVVSYGDKKK